MLVNLNIRIRFLKIMGILLNNIKYIFGIKIIKLYLRICYKVEKINLNDRG